MTPADVDRCSFRDINAMLAGAMDRRRQEEEQNWHRALVIVQSVENALLVFGGKKPLPLDHRFKKKGPKPTMTLQEYRKKRDKALKKVAKRGNGS